MTIEGLAAELEGARLIDFPLRGEWMAVHSPGSRIPSHGTDMLGQRYAFDLIRFDPRRRGRYHPTGGLRSCCSASPRASVTAGASPSAPHSTVWS